MNSCCYGFDNLLASAGERGIAIIVRVNSKGEPRFRLQSRGVSFDDQSKLTPMATDVLINLSTEMGMRYCPFCGRLLELLVASNRDYFNNLSREHEKYVPSELR